MVKYTKEKGAIMWKICHGSATGMVHKQSSEFDKLSKSGDQCLVFLYSSHVNKAALFFFSFLKSIFAYGLWPWRSKAALEVLHELGTCSSYAHMNEVIKKVVEDLQTQLS